MVRRDDRVDVEDQRDASVAEDRRGGDPGHLPVVGLETLDHDLPLVVDGVDQKRATRADLGLDDEHDALERIGGRRAERRAPGRCRSAARSRRDRR